MTAMLNCKGTGDGDRLCEDQCFQSSPGASVGRRCVLVQSVYTDVLSPRIDYCYELLRLCRSGLYSGTWFKQ